MPAEGFNGRLRRAVRAVKSAMARACDAARGAPHDGEGSRGKERAGHDTAREEVSGAKRAPESLRADNDLPLKKSISAW